jgi:hypothetical protein
MMISSWFQVISWLDYFCTGNLMGSDVLKEMLE